MFANIPIFRAFVHIKLKNCSTFAIKQLFPILTNKNNEETDHFTEVFGPSSLLSVNVSMSFGNKPGY